MQTLVLAAVPLRLPSYGLHRKGVTLTWPNGAGVPLDAIELSFIHPPERILVARIVGRNGEGVPLDAIELSFIGIYSGC